MSRRIAVPAVLALAIVLPVGAHSAVERFRADPAPRAWSAMAGTDTASVIRMAATLPAGEQAGALEAAVLDAAGTEVARRSGPRVRVAWPLPDPLGPLVVAAVLLAPSLLAAPRTQG